MFQQAQIHVENAGPYESLRNSIGDTLSRAEAYLARLQKSGLRIRDWEAVLGAGLFGTEAKAQYAVLSDAEKGLIREFYLSKIEQVEPALRFKYRKLYGYY